MLVDDTESPGYKVVVEIDVGAVVFDHIYWVAKNRVDVEDKQRLHHLRDSP